MIADTDTELTLLETLYDSRTTGSSPSQRDLAGAAGLSLGMTNALLRRFAERGWVKFSHLTGRSLQYVLTPEGVAEVSHRAIAYFARAARNASMYRRHVDAFVADAKTRGFGALVLVGPAELDFLFDYSCERHGLAFLKAAGAREAESACAEAGSTGSGPVLRVSTLPRASGVAPDPSTCDDVTFADILMGSVEWPSALSARSD